MDATERKRLLSAYLQGTLPEDQRQRLEAEYAVDDDLFEELIELENDAIDSHARDALSGPPPMRLVKRSSDADTTQRERMGFARALAGLYRTSGQVEPVPSATSETPFSSARLLATPSHRRMALWAAMIAITAGFALLFATNGRLRQELRALRDEQDGLRRSGQDVARQVERLGQELRTQPPGTDGRGAEGARSPAKVASLRLLAGGGRSPGDAQALRVLPGTQILQLELDLDRDDYPRYRAALQTAEGKPIWSRGSLESRHEAGGESLVVLRLPASALPTGDYIVRLTGMTASGVAEPVEAYSFTVAQGPAARQ